MDYFTLPVTTQWAIALVGIGLISVITGAIISWFMRGAIEARNFTKLKKEKYRDFASFKKDIQRLNRLNKQLREELSEKALLLNEQQKIIRSKANTIIQLQKELSELQQTINKYISIKNLKVIKHDIKG